MFDIRAESPASDEDVANFFHQPMITADPVTTHGLSKKEWTPGGGRRINERLHTHAHSRPDSRSSRPRRDHRAFVRTTACDRHAVQRHQRCANLINGPPKPHLELKLDTPSAAPATLEVEQRVRPVRLNISLVSVLLG